jgi:hypothetical protein
MGWRNCLTMIGCGIVILGVASFATTFSEKHFLRDAYLIFCSIWFAYEFFDRQGFFSALSFKISLKSLGGDRAAIMNQAVALGFIKLRSKDLSEIIRSHFPGMRERTNQFLTDRVLLIRAEAVGFNEKILTEKMELDEAKERLFTRYPWLSAENLRKFIPMVLSSSSHGNPYKS